MKCLVVYYSRTGNTKVIAEALATTFTADIEELQDQKDRSGIWQFLVSCVDAILKKPTTIKANKFNPADYDLIVIGTPVWASTMSCAVRTWLEMHSANLKQVAFFATMGSSGDVKTFKDMATIVNKTPLATMAIKEKTIKDNNYQQQLTDFVNGLSKPQQ